MIDALRSDEIVNKVGGKFRLTSLIQRRLVQLMEGARPLVERRDLTPLELVIEEIQQGKIVFEDESGANPDEEDEASTHA